MKALLLIDIQNDFLPGGALAAPEADEIVPIVNKILKHDFDTVVASMDWHPSNHGSFAETHGKKPGEQIDLHGLKQILWPTHCVQGSLGAEFPPELETSKVEKIVYKGTEATIDSYSAFFDNGHLRSTGLEDYLKGKKIQDLYVVGLVTDYCVKYTVLDACQLGFNTFVIADACRGVNLHKDDSTNALKEMAEAGARIISSHDLT